MLLFVWGFWSCHFLFYFERLTFLSFQSTCHLCVCPDNLMSPPVSPLSCASVIVHWSDQPSLFPSLCPQPVLHHISLLFLGTTDFFVCNFNSAVQDQNYFHSCLFFLQSECFLLIVIAFGLPPLGVILILFNLYSLRLLVIFPPVGVIFVSLFYIDSLYSLWRSESLKRRFHSLLFESGPDS